jgi:PDZ domain-containing protein
VGVRAWFSRSTPFWRGVAGLSAAVLAVGSLALIPTPYYVTAPGMALDTSRAILAEGGHQNPDRFYLLTVFAQPANALFWLWGKVDHRVRLETPREFLGTTPDYATYDQMSREMMVNAQRTAKAIALQKVGYGRGVEFQGILVTAITNDSPNKGILALGDRIIGANGRPVRQYADLQAVLKTVQPGESVRLSLVREGQERELTVSTKPHPEDTQRPYLGIQFEQAVTYDDAALPVRILLPWITGPSCGLAMTLQIIDQLTPGGIAPPERIAVTGTIEVDGSVGAVGGVAQKVATAEAAGAKVIMVPEANQAEALAAARRIQVVPVGSIDQALDWLRGAHAGQKK